MENVSRECEICNIMYEEDWFHKASDLHRFNFLLFEWNRYRKSLVKNRNGVKIDQQIKGQDIDEIETTYDRLSGSFIVEMSSEKHSSLTNGVQCSFTIGNERRNDNICLLKVTVLHPHYDDAVKIVDRRNIFQQRKVLELGPKQEYKVTAQIKLNLSAVGSYKIPLAFSFQVHGRNEVDSFTFAREIIIVISDYNQVDEDEGESPFKNSVWKNVHTFIPLVGKLYRTNDYPIPKQYFKVLMAGLVSNKYFGDGDLETLDYIKNVFDPYFSTTRDFNPQFPTADNYRDFYHFLIWIEEIGQRLMLQRYNMSNVTMTVVQGKMLELEVPGLAEKRPSLLPGDLVKIRLHEDHTVYQGVVKTINDKTIWIHNVNNELVSFIRDSEEDIELDVAFELSRLPYERKHKGVDDCVDRGLLSTLFPDASLQNRSMRQTIEISDNKFFNQSILQNNEQKNAVLNILNGTSHHAPYIVFGPPGTGKTATIVEAILQLKANFKGGKILVCAPANAACDMLTAKLIPFCNQKELIRIHAQSRNCSYTGGVLDIDGMCPSEATNSRRGHEFFGGVSTKTRGSSGTSSADYLLFMDDVPNDIKPYSNYDGTNYKLLAAQQVATFKIVITTLVLIGKYSGKYAPDYVFIDEAAQAMEPEADIAIGLLSRSKHLILAGDPKQMGPHVVSRAAKKLKLDVSLLERLMTTNSLYMNGNTEFIAMLILNYRAHPTVLQIPNDLFYEGKLIPVNRTVLHDPVSKIFIYPRLLPGPNKDKAKGEAVEFYAVFAKEQRQGKSPSYFNESEIQTTIKCIEALLSLPETRVCQSDIGVVTPYIRQVHRLKQRLEQLALTKIEVGTAEVYQGREKRILIVSTVRAQHSLLLFDKRYKLGFVSNEKRLNVTLTRAMSKLIVIGNPLVLETDVNWLRCIQFCEEKGAYFGRKYTRRTDAVKRDIGQRLEAIKVRRTHQSGQVGYH